MRGARHDQLDDVAPAFVLLGPAATRADLTGSAGKLIMGGIGAVAEFKRDLLIKRRQSGPARVRAAGKASGREPSRPDDQQHAVRQNLTAAVSVVQMARDLRTTRQTVMPVRAPAEVNAGTQSSDA